MAASAYPAVEPPNEHVRNALQLLFELREDLSPAERARHAPTLVAIEGRLRAALDKLEGRAVS